MSFTGEETLFGEDAIFHKCDGEIVEQPEKVNEPEGSINYVKILFPTANDDDQDKIYLCQKKPSGVSAYMCLLDKCANKETPASEAQGLNCHHVKQAMRLQNIDLRKENLVQRVDGESGEDKTLTVLIAPLIARERHS